MGLTFFSCANNSAYHANYTTPSYTTSTTTNYDKTRSLSSSCPKIRTSQPKNKISRQK